jgi:hypothetical protein
MIPYTLAGREIRINAAGHRADAPAAPCIFCGRSIRHFDAGGTGWLLGVVAGGEPAVYVRCIEGPCARASERWVWRCGCAGHHVENVGDRCHACLRPRHEAVAYDHVECTACGAARWLDDRLGIGNGRCLRCTGGPAYLPMLYIVPRDTSLAILPGGAYGE